MLSQDSGHQTPTATASESDDQSPTDDQTATPTDDQRSIGPWRYRKCKIQSRQRLILNIRERKRNLDIKQVLSELGQLLPTKPNERLMDRTRLCLLKSAYKFIYRLSDFARFCDFTCRAGNTLQTLTASGGQSAPSGAPLNSLIKAYCSQFKPATFSHQYSHVLPPANHNHALQQYHAQVPPHHAQEAVPIPTPSENFKFQEPNAYGQDGNCQHQTPTQHIEYLQHQTPTQHFWIHASSSAVAPSRHANPCDVMSAQPCDVMSAQPCDVMSAQPYDMYSIRSNDDMATLPRHVPDEPYFSPPQHQVPHLHGQWAAGGQWTTDGQTFCALPVCFPRPPDVQKFPFSHGDSSNRLYPVIYHGPHPPVLPPGVMHHPPPTTLQCRSMGIMPATCCPIMFDASHAQMVGHH